MQCGVRIGLGSNILSLWMQMRVVSLYMIWAKGLVIREILFHLAGTGRFNRIQFLWLFLWNFHVWACHGLGYMKKIILARGHLACRKAEPHKGATFFNSHAQTHINKLSMFWKLALCTFLRKKHGRGNKDAKCRRKTTTYMDKKYGGWFN